MANPVLSTSIDGSLDKTVHTELEAAASLEQQIVILVTYAQQQETDYNKANPSEAPKNRLTVERDFEAGEINISGQLLLTSDAVRKAPNDSIVAHIPAS